ncbi:fatty acid desaturase, partial [Pseudomonas syringae]
EPHVWRWSHARHHTDTIVVGRDPEIVEPRPPSRAMMFLSLFQIPLPIKTVGGVCRHAVAHMSEQEKDFIPVSEWPRVFLAARIGLAIYAGVVAAALCLPSWLPLMYVGLPMLYGGWLTYVLGRTPPVGLADDVPRSRRPRRTI